MTEFNSTLEIAPDLVKALQAEKFPLHKIAIANFNEDGEAEHEQIVWTRRLDQDVFEIISPIWISQDFKYGDIISVENTFSFSEVYWADWVCKESDFKTLTIVPNKKGGDVANLIAELHRVIGKTGWICEIVEQHLVVAVLSPDLHQKHRNEITAALASKALVRGPGPWCARYLEAWKAGDESKAIKEFLREEVAEAV
jgi:hypothetical protein